MPSPLFDRTLWEQELRSYYEEDMSLDPHVMNKIKMQMAEKAAADKNRVLGLIEMIGVRFFGKATKELPFDKLDAYRGTDKVFVFLGHNGEASILEDDPNLFPSDKLITSLRLVAKEGFKRDAGDVIAIGGSR
jgi:hypothetical protein